MNEKKGRIVDMLIVKRKGLRQSESDEFPRFSNGGHLMILQACVCYEEAPQRRVGRGGNVCFTLLRKHRAVGHSKKSNKHKLRNKNETDALTIF